MLKFKSRQTFLDQGALNKNATGGLGTNAMNIRKNKKGLNRSNVDWSSTSASLSGLTNTNVAQMPIEVDIDPLLKDIIFSEDLEQKKLVYRLYRDMYYNDPVAGSAVDLLSTLPFSDFTLGGISDRKALSIFQETIERLNIRTILPDVSTDFLVTGNFIGSLLFNTTSKKFLDIMPHQGDNVKIESLPFYSQDPIITVAFPDSVRALLTDGTESPRIKKLRERLGPELLKSLSEPALELDPISTIYLPRKSFSSGEGTSWFRRILPIYLIEKNLFRGTLIESARRQRGILHITLGDGDQWEPSLADMDFMTELFNNADADPLGAIIATRMGVVTEELRQGGDFWKVTDIWDQTASFKLRALGISEAFLSGEANYACLTGDSLIPTTDGLIRLDELVGKEHLPEDLSESKKDLYVPIDYRVLSRYATEKAAKWKYSGYTETLKIKTSLGNELCATGSHPFLVFDSHGNTVWKKADKLKVGDNLCMPAKGLVRTKELQLDLETFGTTLRKPTVMGCDLAYILGALCNSAQLDFDGYLEITSTNSVYLEKIIDCIEYVFSLEELVLSVRPKEALDGFSREYTIKFKEYNSEENNHLLNWLLSLVNGKPSNSMNITAVPNCILQADCKSQLAFIASYIECSGKVGENIVITGNETFIAQFQTMLFAHNIMAYREGGTITLSRAYSRELWQKTYEFRCFLSRKDEEYPSDCGFSLSFLRRFVKSREIAYVRGGVLLLDDNGAEVLVKNYSKFVKMMSKGFLYDYFAADGYNDFFDTLYSISHSMYYKLLYLVHLKYAIVQVTEISENGKQHVYDISMDKGVEPAFVANGIIVHNTADTSLTVFIDFIRAYRDTLTRKLFYNKLFPLISLVNGFTVNSKGKLIRKENLMANGGVEDWLSIMQDGSKLLIPNVHWAKQLKPEGDSTYLDMLQSLTDKGVPVPLRALAAAGGFNLDSLLADGDDDEELLKRVSEYHKRMAEVKKKYGPAVAEGEGGGEEALSATRDDSMERMLGLSSNTHSDVLASNLGRRPKLSSRNYGDLSEITGETKTGKKKWIYNQKRAQEKANANIAKAIKNINKNKSNPLFGTS